ncbi:hypothetical protein ElyMa_000230300 [Elysia marginata]|uniref:Uncharacterized protein n=1 Tax=Elysia marginata TaxID=1093978 RepID=A0AAV4EZP6_9GAST|nr:hypothetical protein ElyMa_000230300 [Elysia marginata]
MDSEVVQPGEMPNTLMQDDVGVDESDSLKKKQSKDKDCLHVPKKEEPDDSEPPPLKAAVNNEEVPSDNTNGVSTNGEGVENGANASNEDEKMKQEIPRKRGSDSISSEVPDVMQMPGFMHEDQTVKLNVDNDEDESMEISGKARSKKPITSPEKLAAVRKEAEMSFGFDEDGEEEPAPSDKDQTKGSHSPRGAGKPEKSSTVVAEAPKRRGRPPKIRNDSESSQKVAVMSPKPAKVVANEDGTISLKTGSKTPTREETTEEEVEEEEERTTSGRRRAKPPKRYGDEPPKLAKVKEEKGVKGKTKSSDAEEGDCTPKVVEVVTPGSAKRGRPRKDPNADPKSPKPRGRPRKEIGSEEENDQEEDETPVPKSLKITPKQTAILELQGKVVTPKEDPPKKREEEEEEEEIEEEEMDETGEILDEIDNDDDEEEEDDEEYSPGRKPRGKAKKKGSPGKKRPRSQSEIVVIPFNAGVKQEPGIQEVVEDGVVEVKNIVSTPQHSGKNTCVTLSDERDVKDVDVNISK